MGMLSPMHDMLLSLWLCTAMTADIDLLISSTHISYATTTASNCSNIMVKVPSDWGRQNARYFAAADEAA